MTTTMSDTNTIPAEVRLVSALDEIQPRAPFVLRSVDDARAALAELIAERDSLAAEVERFHGGLAVATGHADRVERERDELIAERDRWRSSADSLALAHSSMEGELAKIRAERDDLASCNERQRADLSEALAEAERHARAVNEAHERIARIRELVRQSARNSMALAEIL